MGHYIKVLSLSLPICFLMGLWWGISTEEDIDKITFKGEKLLRVLALSNHAPNKSLARFEDLNNVKIIMHRESRVGDFLDKLKSQPEYFDLILIPSYYLDFFTKNYEWLNLKDIDFRVPLSPDFHRLEDKTENNFKILSWAVLGVVGPKGITINKDNFLKSIHFSNEIEAWFHLAQSTEYDFPSWIKERDENKVKTFARNWAKNMNKDGDFNITTQAYNHINPKPESRFYWPKGKLFMWYQSAGVLSHSKNSKTAKRLIHFLRDIPQNITMNKELGMATPLHLDHIPKLPTELTVKYFSKLPLDRIHWVNFDPTDVEYWESNLNNALAKEGFKVAKD